MSITLLTVAVAVGFIDYPGFVDPRARVEAVIDRGPILELILKCPPGTAILSYSKVEHLYCTPTKGCTSDLKVAIGRTCR